MSEHNETLELTVKRTINAERAELFEAWLTPEALTEFIRPAPNMSVPKAEVDAKVGGNFLIVMRVGDNDLEHRGEYKEINKYDRLVFTWISSMTIAGSTVTLDFKDVGDGKTEITLHHVGFPNEESRGNHHGGWESIVETLAAHVTKQAKKSA